MQRTTENRNVPLRVLVCTNLYPTEDDPAFGTFVRDEVEALRRLGLWVDVLFVNGKRSRWNYAGAPLRLWWRLARRRYDVLHAHYGLTGLITLLQWCLPVVVTFHGDEVALGWPAQVSRWLRDRVDAVIVTSHRVRDDLGAPNARVIPPGVDFQLFQPSDRSAARAKLGLPLDQELVLFVGRASWEKRLEAVQTAVRLLQDGRPHARLLLVSGQPHERIPLYMNAGDVLLLLSGYEGSPMVVKEALACNLAVVASDVGDVAELISAVEGCTLCDGTPEDAARKLAIVLERGQRVAGRETIAHLSLESEAKKVAAVYEQVVAARGAAPAPMGK
jgi:teichuronic acid biosynthesis glycosyltransferase TuaC